MLAVHDYLVRSGAQLQGHRGRGTRYAFASRARGSACARQSDSRLRSLVFVQYSPAMREAFNFVASAYNFLSGEAPLAFYSIV